MFYVPNHAGQSNLNQLNYKNLVSQALPRVMPLNAVTAITPLHDETKPHDKALVAGQTYEAKVMGKPLAKHYDVLIHQQLYRIQLDKPLQVGERLQFKFLAFSAPQDPSNGLGNQPQGANLPTKSLNTPQFLLQSLVQSAQTSQARTGDVAFNRHQQPVPTISQTGQLIQSVLASQQQLAPLLKATEVPMQQQAKIDLPHTQLPLGPVTAELIAPFLRQQIRSSGLFYESHLQQFAAGIRAAESLIDEPQNRPNADIAGLVAKQLEVFETKQMHWHGQAWPGQSMDWTIEVKPRNSTEHQDASAAHADEAHSIASHMQLHLPKLGQLDLTIAYQNERLTIKIQTENSQTQSILVAEQQRLHAAFNRQDQPLAQLDIV